MTKLPVLAGRGTVDKLYPMNHIYNHRELALAYHRRLPERIRSHLVSLGITNSIICRYRIGWDGSRITIPITDRERRVTYFRLIRDPEAPDAAGEFTSWPEASLELYGWERVMSQREGIVICNGEMSRLILESRGIAAVSVPAGVSSLPNEWCRLLSQIPVLYICLTPTETTLVSMSALRAAIPHARQIPPQMLGEGGISGYFVRDGRTLEDFTALCSSAPRLDEIPLIEDADV